MLVRNSQLRRQSLSGNLSAICLSHSDSVSLSTNASDKAIWLEGYICTLENLLRSESFLQKSYPQEHRSYPQGLDMTKPPPQWRGPVCVNGLLVFNPERECCLLAIDGCSTVSNLDL